MNPPSSSPHVASDSPFRRNRSRSAFALAGFGLILRLRGIAWSLPDARRFYSCHPDEILVLAASRSADLWHGAFNPHFYNYGSLPVYLISLLRPLAYALLSPSLYYDYLLRRFLRRLLQLRFCQNGKYAISQPNQYSIYLLNHF